MRWIMLLDCNSLFITICGPVEQTEVITSWNCNKPLVSPLYSLIRCGNLSFLTIAMYNAYTESCLYRPIFKSLANSQERILYFLKQNASCDLIHDASDDSFAFGLYWPIFSDIKAFLTPSPSPLVIRMTWWNFKLKEDHLR